MKRLILILCALVIVSCAGENAGNPGQPPAEQQAAATPPPPPLPPPSPEQMMELMKKAATPGPEHKRLAPLVGTFKTESKFWMDPSKPPQIEKGSAKNEWVFGKRFVKQAYTGKFNGQPFQGMGYIGFDNVKKAYVSTWMDSMGTGVMVSEGTFDSANRALEMSSTFSCPLTGGERNARFVTRIINDNEYVDEMFDKGPDGKEFKMMEIHYKKQG